jgi:hypothetical protein
MPSTRSRTLKSRTELERERELEALGLGIAPGLPGDGLARSKDVLIEAPAPARAATKNGRTVGRIAPRGA